MNEQTERASLRARGGLRNKRGNATWPLALLTASAKAIELRGPLGGARFSASQQVKISFRDGLTATGLRFASEDLHTGAVTFWTGRRDEIARRLRDLGWVVDESSDANGVG